jgi:hypothetical protein
MNGIVVIIGEGLHIIKHYPVNYKNGKACDEFAGN